MQIILIVKLKFITTHQLSKAEPGDLVVLVEDLVEDMVIQLLS